MLLTVPQGGKSGMLGVTFVQLVPPSRVTCTSPSLLPVSDQSFFDGRLGNGKEYAAISGTAIVRGQPPRSLLFALVVGSQIGTDDTPAMSSIGRNMHMLAANIDLVVVVGRYCQGKVPLEAIFQFGSRPIKATLRPDINRSLVARPQIEAVECSVVATRPNDIVVDRIGSGKAGLPTAHRLPHAHGDYAAC